MKNISQEENCSIVNLSSISAHQAQPNRSYQSIHSYSLSLGIKFKVMFIKVEKTIDIVDIIRGLYFETFTAVIYGFS